MVRRVSAVQLGVACGAVLLVALVLARPCSAPAPAHPPGRSAPLPRTVDPSSPEIPSSTVASAKPPREPSRCFGTVGRGSLEGGWRLPLRGDNFQAYGEPGWRAGRTYLHSDVHELVLATYRKLAASHPELRFVYGETGRVGGGPFEPHRTHQNGTSVDFMIPVRDSRGRPSVLPADSSNRWGYDIDFDDQGRSGGLEIDLPALALHLAALRQVSKKMRISMKKVVLYPPLRRKLRTTAVWAEIERLPYTRTESWVRHDDHFHVDFGVKCASNR